MVSQSSSSQFSPLGKISYGRVKSNPGCKPNHLPKFPRIQSAIQLFNRSRQSPDASLTHQLLHPKPRVIRNATLAVPCRRSPRGNKLPPIVHPQVRKTPPLPRQLVKVSVRREDRPGHIFPVDQVKGSLRWNYAMRHEQITAEGHKINLRGKGALVWRNPLNPMNRISLPSPKPSKMQDGGRCTLEQFCFLDTSGNRLDICVPIHPTCSLFRYAHHCKNALGKGVNQSGRTCTNDPVLPSWIQLTLTSLPMLDLVLLYPSTKPFTFSVTGKVIRIVVASGKVLYCSTFPEDGSKLKGIVPSRPSLEVAAKGTSLDSSNGIRNPDVQPAPRISNSTCVVG